MSKSKAIGTRAETKVRRYFEAHGIHCKRKALAGSNDEGDLRLLIPGGPEVTVEVKAGKQTGNYSRRQLDEWKRQTVVEGLNSGCPAMLVLVRYRRPFVDSEVWMPNEAKGDHMPAWSMTYIDSFVEEIGG